MSWIIRSDSHGGNWRGRARKWAADRLHAAAQRLDPGRPTSARNSDGSHTITVGWGGVLATITPGVAQLPTSFEPEGWIVHSERIGSPEEAQAAIDDAYRRNTGGDR